MTKITREGSENLKKNAVSRRRFLGAIFASGSALTVAVLTAPLIRFVFYPILRPDSETVWSEIGLLTDFIHLKEPLLKTIRVDQRDGWRNLVLEKAVYVVLGPNGKVRVLSPVCPHLGCLIGWHSENKTFVSPCHNGIFGPDGRLISGPPRRSMDELETRVENGRLLVKYQYFRPLVAEKETAG